MSQAQGAEDDQDLIASDSAPAQARSRGSSLLIGVKVTRRQRRVVLAVVVGFGLLAAACLIAAILAWRGEQVTDAVIAARQTRRSGTMVLQALLNAETSQRGFLLTRDPEYLSPYTAAAGDFATWMRELQGRLPADSPRANLAGAVARLGAAKFAEMDQTIALAKEGRVDDALALMRAGGGKALMDEVRRDVDGLTAGANGVVDSATATQIRLSTMLLVAIVVALLCVASLAVLLLRDTRQRIRRLSAREASLNELAAVLEQEVSRRTQALAEVNQRFDVALRASGVTVMTQDRDLLFTWISKGEFGLSAEEIVGRPQSEVYPGLEQTASLQLKRGVIETGEPARGDVRVVHQGAEKWFDLSVHPLTGDDGAVNGLITGAIDITRYKEQEARIRLLMRELTHRSKNLLSVTQAIMRQTAANSVSIADFDERFSARLQSLAGSHDLLVREDWRGASLRELVRSQLGHYTDLVGLGRSS